MRQRSRSVIGSAVIAASILVCDVAGAGSLTPADVRVEEDRLSLDAKGLPLADLLAAVSAASGIAFTLRGDASRIVVSDSFEDLELRRGLQRILAAHSHLLVDRGVVDSIRQLDVVLLGSDIGNPPQEIRAVPSVEPAAGTLEEPVAGLLGKAVSSAPAAERAAAMEAIAYRSEAEGGGSVADALLLQLMSDPDSELRALAIETIKDTADETPFAALAQVAREDASAALRMQALELLVERSEDGEWREPLRIALNDSAPAVRERARDLALDWHLDVHE